jgi:hypothetical protein
LRYVKPELITEICKKEWYLYWKYYSKKLN